MEDTSAVEQFNLCGRLCREWTEAVVDGREGQVGGRGGDRGGDRK